MDEALAASDDPAVAGVMMLTVYLAADFSRAGDAESVARLIEQTEGVSVVSRWHRQPNPDEVASAGELGGPPDRAVARAAAQRNLDDIDRCDVFVVMTTGTAARGGRHFETGYAHAHNKRIVVSGPTEHAFQHLANDIIGDETQLPDLLGRIQSENASAAE